MHRVHSIFLRFLGEESPCALCLNSTHRLPNFHEAVGIKDRTGLHQGRGFVKVSSVDEQIAPTISGPFNRCEPSTKNRSPYDAEAENWISTDEIRWSLPRFRKPYCHYCFPVATTVESLRLYAGRQSYITAEHNRLLSD